MSDELKKLMSDPSAKKIMVVGGPDTGKTTTLRAMLSAAVGPVALVDLDVGQSHVGPPAMLAWGWWREDRAELEDVVPERVFFVGATSPLANPAGAISGAAAVVSDAADHSDKVLIDTSGAIVGRFARRLKLEKTRTLGPDVVVALQREDELEHILGEIERERLATVIRMPAPNSASQKTPKERGSYRQAKFAAYFEPAADVRIPLDEAEVMRFGAASQVEDECNGLVQGMLVGLVDRVGRHQGMGILQSIDREGHTLVVLASLAPGTRIAAVIPGRMRLTSGGKEQPLPK